MAKSESPVTFDELERRIGDWACGRDDIRAAMIVGSRARSDRPADAWADLDLWLVVRRPNRDLSDHSWLRDIARPIVHYKDRSGATIHVLFEGGLDAGLAFLPLAAFKNVLRFIAPLKRRPMLQRALPFGLGDRIDALLGQAGAYYRRGYRVLLDKDGMIERFMAAFPAGRASRLAPSADEFNDAVSEFWFNTVWIAKHLRRGELWWAIKGGWHDHLTPLMLRMVEWRVGSEQGWSIDVWTDGRFLEDWAGAETTSLLASTFPDYDEGSIWRALFASMAAYRTLAIATAERLGYEYDASADEGATAIVSQLFAGRPPTAR